MASPRGDPLLGMTMSDEVSMLDKDNSLEDFQLRTISFDSQYDMSSRAINWEIRLMTIS